MGFEDSHEKFLFDVFDVLNCHFKFVSSSRLSSSVDEIGKVLSSFQGSVHHDPMDLALIL